MLRNKFSVTAGVIFMAYLIGATGGWQKIWPIFGATNQLIAAVALMVISTYLVGIKKPTHFTLLPALFMIVTTIGALLWQAYRFFTAAEPNLFLGTTALVLTGLAVFVGLEGWSALKGRRPLGEPAANEI